MIGAEATTADSSNLRTHPRMDLFLGLTSVVPGIVLGITVALAWPKNAAHVSSPSLADQTATYLHVREANMGLS